MKLISYCVVFMILMNTIVLSQQETQMFMEKVDRFLNTYVDNGRVDYSLIKSNDDQLSELTDIIEHFDLNWLNQKNIQKAFWINVYNIYVIKSVIENYPISSPLKVDGFFNKTKHMAGRRELTLNEIEKKILFDIDHDPRLHFAVVCAAVGCPQIISEAYRPNDLDEMLEERAIEVLSDDYYIKVDKENRKVYLNEIFKWYKSDFEQNDLSLIDFINKYRTDKIPSDFSIEYISYDWKLNEKESYNIGEVGVTDLQSYTPSVLLSKGQYELKLFNNLYTQTAFFNDKSERTDQNGRSTYNTFLISFLYGLSGGLNLGFEVWVKSVRNDFESASPFDVFNFDNSTTNRTAISGIGPKIKISPISSGIFKNLSIQSIFLIPTESNLEGSLSEPFLDSDSYLFLNQFFYDRNISSQFSFFGELDLWFRIDRNLEGKRNSLQIPTKGFLSYYPSNKLTLYYMIELSYKFGEGSSQSYYSQTGLGLKYQLFPWVELEGLVTIFYLGKNSGAGQTLNLGIRIVDNL